MFTKILIANRGEIACRVIRTAREMGIGSVAVYSDADAQALHVGMADEAVHIGPAPATDSYLKADAIIEAARRTGAQAIHPGYGFLAENAAFAEACAAAGITFVGPSADAIRAMGLKDAAKKLMEEAGVPVVPGYHGQDQATETLEAAAGDIGFPVLIKAVAGGGGKGMRRVDHAHEFEAALTAAQREAKGAFGDDRVLVEKFITKPRHIEVQVFGDTHGTVVHLFERDCSIQRRHQKVVEEAPAPDMPTALREAMCTAAIKAAKAIDYVGAGTIEFIVDASKGLETADFFFMEMNTRLQVEHPVTEAVTGQDLVAWQLRVAAGQPLPCPQDHLALGGHAVEVRLYAEDPARGFLPATGRLTLFDTPAGDGVRVDTGVQGGDAISIHYDPMIAKIVAHGADREQALHRLDRALAATRITGLVTNLDFLRRVVTDDAFVAGDVHTGYIDQRGDALTPEPPATDTRLLALAALGVIDARHRRARAAIDRSADPSSPWHAVDGWTPNLAAAEVLRFIGPDGQEHGVTLGSTGTDYRLLIGEDTIIGSITRVTGGPTAYVLDGLRIAADVSVTPETVTVIDQGQVRELKRIQLRLETAEDAEGPGAVTAPMPGKLLELKVAEGDAVDKDAPLLVLEAMKMEHTLTAPKAGIVAAIAAAPGDQVSEGAPLITIGDAE